MQSARGPAPFCRRVTANLVADPCVCGWYGRPSCTRIPHRSVTCQSAVFNVRSRRAARCRRTWRERICATPRHAAVPVAAAHCARSPTRSARPSITCRAGSKSSGISSRSTPPGPVGACISENARASAAAARLDTHDPRRARPRPRKRAEPVCSRLVAGAKWIRTSSSVPIGNTLHRPR